MTQAVNHPVSIKGVLLLQGCVVLVKNSRDEWELPGGRSEPGEDHFQTLARELAEELSVEISTAKLIDSYLFEVIPGRHVSIITYGCTIAGEFAPRISDEHIEHCLWPVSRLSEINLPVGYRESVEKWAMLSNSSMELGLGLIGIGREWGAGDRSVASEMQADEILRQALALNIGFFDTAPSYGLSEARLGRFLSGLSSKLRRGVRVATKFGELWSGRSAVVDHSYHSLCRSVDRSLHLLGPIDLLQIHKCTAAVLALPSVRRAVEYARGLGVRAIGASVSDAEACEMAARAEFIDAIQLPLNSRRPELAGAARSARARGKLVIANRPVDSGHILAAADGERRASILRDSFSFLARQRAADIVLTGTRSSSHLRENCMAFRSAVADTA